MNWKAAALCTVATIAAAAVFGEYKMDLPSGTVSAEETASAETAGTEETETASAGYSRPYEEAIYGPTGAEQWIDFSVLQHRTEDENAPVVYFTDNISPQGLLDIYHACGFTPEGNVGVKVSTGEAGNYFFLNPNLVKDLVWEVDGTIIECNTAEYGGMRSATAMHYQVAADHGWTDIADVDILDQFGTMTVPIDGTYLSEIVVGEGLGSYDSIIVLSHFKGHTIAGFGGAMKNVAIGLSAPEGKCLIHSAGADRYVFTGCTQEAFTASMAETVQAIQELKGGRMLYINIMNNISVDCDCVGSPALPTMLNVGILASTDPVALDQACVDIVYAAPDGGDVRARIERQQGTLILDHSEKIGFGNRWYRFNMIDHSE